ncbi:snRNA-activating protein complex subunit 2 [Acanthochromis polyacanthus]|uniref:snRNA-activating protein complex subunit 2 n=1 Tax=Acanthochromis polyacanthus TaxID=80966 RepID=UPI00223427D8|nr:snRNA-activating protein complex subunit 2 [Acanthochromis polyacanthus]
MKPPPRARVKPNRNLRGESENCSGKVACRWQRAEQTKLLRALQRLSRTTGAKEDIDCAFLAKYVPTRSISEIHSVVESLKDKVISCATIKWKRKMWEEKKVRKPIEDWTNMASAVTGSLEETISKAFSQMLMVSSTEPRTLRNCDPPQVHRPPSDSKPTGRTIPLRPMPRQLVKGKKPGTNTSHPRVLLKTPAPTLGQARRLQAQSQVVRVPNGKIRPPQQQPSPTAGRSPSATSTSQSQNAEQPTTIPSTSASKSVSSSSHVTLSSSAKTLTSVVSTASSTATVSCSAPSSSSLTHPTPPLSTTAAAFHSKFGRTSKYATKDSPRTFGVKCVVDFEKIYHFLSVIHKPSEKCHLTPMESAIVLDLLMSLPEQLPLLDCNKLRKHLIQVHQCLSGPPDSKRAKEMFQNLNNGLSPMTESQSSSDLDRKISNQNTAVTADSTDVSKCGTEKLQQHETESQSSGSSNTSGDADMMGRCPPLNPFMVPLKLLMNR